MADKQLQNEIYKIDFVLPIADKEYRGLRWQTYVKIKITEIILLISLRRHEVQHAIQSFLLLFFFFFKKNNN